MSKANRIKGKYDPLLNCRVTTVQRLTDLEQRKDGITERHTPKPSRKIKAKITKTMRKAMRTLSKQFKGTDSNHPLTRTADMQERGHAMYMSLISSITMKPENTL